MASTFLGIEIGLRALRAHQQALNVTAHNVANSATPGYSRQQAILQATVPQSIPGVVGQIGTGVAMYQVARSRDAFLDAQLRNETSSYHRYSALMSGLDKIQAFFNEPSDNGLSAAMARFWSSFQDVANNPESESSRRIAIQAGEALASVFRHMSRQLSDLEVETTMAVRDRVEEINYLALQIAKLNDQIQSISLIPGEQPNDLKDQRDLLIDRLSTIIRIRVVEDQKSNIQVFVGSESLVNGSTSSKVTFSDGMSGPELTLNGTDIIPPEGAPALGGTIGGLLELRNEAIVTYRDGLDQMARGLIAAVNAVHRTGWGLNDTEHVERDFFEGTGAADIVVSPAIAADPAKVAASGNGLPGDGSRALEIARLKEALSMSSGTATFGDFLGGLVGRLGVQSDQAVRFVKNEDLLIKEIESLRQEVQGVSLDEEMANMVKFQHAYTAAARLITAIDEMLDILVNRTGLTGR